MTVRPSRPPGSQTNSTATAPAQAAPRARAGRRVEEVMAR